MTMDQYVLFMGDFIELDGEQRAPRSSSLTSVITAVNGDGYLDHDEVAPAAGAVETERNKRSGQVVRMLHLQLGRLPSAAETGVLMELMDVQRVDKVDNPHSQEMHREQSQSVRHQDSQCIRCLS